MIDELTDAGSWRWIASEEKIAADLATKTKKLDLGPRGLCKKVLPF